MCTVSWNVRAGGYDLLFNRDEKHARGAERPPVVRQRDARTVIAPSDSDRGGAWIALNDCGLTVCLLNDYDHTPDLRFPPPHSRGSVVLACSEASTLPDVLARVRRQPLTETGPFYLLALMPGESPLLLHWQGAELREIETAGLMPMLSSSSFSPREVLAFRRRRFNAIVGAAAEPTVPDQWRFQTEHHPSDPAHSVLMCRGDASTRSVTHVTVAEHRATVRYHAVHWPGGRLQRAHILHLATGTGSKPLENGDSPNALVTSSRESPRAFAPPTSDAE